jgi:hypothetical protein
MADLGRKNTGILQEHWHSRGLIRAACACPTNVCLQCCVERKRRKSGICQRQPFGTHVGGFQKGRTRVLLGNDLSGLKATACCIGLDA